MLVCLASRVYQEILCHYIMFVNACVVCICIVCDLAQLGVRAERMRIRGLQGCSPVESKNSIPRMRHSLFL